MVLNQQSEVRVDVRDAQAFAARLGRALKLGRRRFNVSFVDDRSIARLNAAYLGRRRPTDVLSFPWESAKNGDPPVAAREFRNFLGDIVIATPTARRNARAEGHSTRQEIRWLILHGLLHLLGYDHETDAGEMTARELALRDRLDRPAPRRRKKGVRHRVA